MLYKIFQICTTLPLVKISAQPDVVYWICYPKTPQSRSNWVLNQKNVLFLLGKVENNKYTEIKTWNPERIEEWSYYRFCETLWHDHKGQFRPIRLPPIFYLFIYYFFWVGDGVGYKNPVIFLGPWNYFIWYSKGCSFCRSFGL